MTVAITLAAHQTATKLPLCSTLLMVSAPTETLFPPATRVNEWPGRCDNWPSDQWTNEPRLKELSLSNSRDGDCMCAEGSLGCLLKCHLRRPIHGWWRWLCGGGGYSSASPFTTFAYPMALTVFITNYLIVLLLLLLLSLSIFHFIVCQPSVLWLPSCGSHRRYATVHPAS